jgi:hypothetical protein
VYKLYKKERSTLHFADYGEIMSAVAGMKSVLEFGPGLTTLALIEAGVPKIVSLESDPEWLEKQREELKAYPQVELHSFEDEVPVRINAELGKFDLALVDSPAGFSHKVTGRKPRKIHPGMSDCSRLNTCLAALNHAPVVLLHDAFRSTERATVGRLSAMGYDISYIVTKVGIARICKRESI